MDFRLTDGAAAAQAHRPRVRGSRDPAARPRVGRGAALSRPSCAEARRARAARASSGPRSTAAPGMSAVDYCICIEELARVDPSVALSVAAHNGLCSAHIAMFGSEEQKQTFLVPLARGEKIGAWGLTEATLGQRRGRPAHERPRKSGDGWVLNGSKALHDARPRRRCHRRDGGHRPHRRAERHLGVHRRARDAGHDARKEGRQARDARERHERSGLRGLPRPGRPACSARKGRDSSTRCRCSTPAASASPRWRSASRRARTKPR